MILAAALTLSATLLLAAGGPRLARALPGRAASWLISSAALVCSITSGLVLCVFAGLAVVQIDVIADHGHWSEAAIAAASPIPLPVSVLCGPVAAALLASAVIRAVRALQALRRSARVCRQFGAATDGLIIIDDDHPDAYAVPGLPGRAVVTRGMLRELSAGQRRALLAHETAHVTHHHFVYLELTTLAVAANPLLRPLTSAVRVSLERWADEVAAAEVGDRRLVATTLARAGLIRLRSGPTTVPAGALAVAATAVAQRVEALRTVRSPAASRTVAALLALIMATSVLGCVVVATGAHDIVEYAELVVTGSG